MTRAFPRASRRVMPDGMVPGARPERKASHLRRDAQP